MTKNQPTAALIVIGNEILSGRTQDLNINYIAKQLSDIGVKFVEVSIIADIEQKIIDMAQEFSDKYDYVFTTGGIGPTHDDITTESIAKAFNKKIVQNEDALALLNEFYNGELNPGRLKMTKLPEDAKIIRNPISLAPGFIVENVYVMAGIPNVMQAMFDGLKYSLKGGDPVKTVEVTIIVSESKIASPLTELQNKYPDVEIGSYPFVRDNRIGTNIVLRCSDADLLEQAKNDLQPIVDLGE